MSNNEKAANAIVLLAVADIKKAQDGIRTALVSLDTEIHANAVQCLMHAEKHNDTSLMRRLLVDIIDTKTGYRRQGLINWMRKWSPLELAKDSINMSGTDFAGNKRPFKIEEANATPFWLDADNNEKVAVPMYQKNLFTKLTSAADAFRDAVANTKDGKPIDPTKAFYPGKYTDEIGDFLFRMEIDVAGLAVKCKDDTEAVAKAHAKQAKVAAKAEQPA